MFSLFRLYRVIFIPVILVTYLNHTGFKLDAMTIFLAVIWLLSVRSFMKSRRRKQVAANPFGVK